MRFSFLAMLVACGTSRAQFVDELAELQCEQSLTCDWDGEYCGDSYHDELEYEFGEANCAVWDAAAASACLELVRAAAEDSECEGDRVSCDGPCRRAFGRERAAAPAPVPISWVSRPSDFCLTSSHDALSPLLISPKEGGRLLTSKVAPGW